MTTQMNGSVVPDAGDVYAGLAAEVLNRHNSGHSETDIIRSAVRDFIIQSGLVTSIEVTQEESPTQEASGRVDLRDGLTWWRGMLSLSSGSRCATSTAGRHPLLTLTRTQSDSNWRR